MGVFIYKTKGKFPDNFVMEAVDVLLMAKGEPAEVGYTANSEFIGDIIDLEYDEYSRGIIHSHQNLSTSPSSTDIQQVQQWASTNPYYLSVIVNNKLDFHAMVAIKSTEKYKGYSYFKNLKGQEVKTPKEYTRESYEIINVDVVVEIPKYIEDVNFRIKNRMQNYSTPTYTSGYIQHDYKGYQPYKSSKPNYYASHAKPKQQYLNFKETQEDVLEDFVEEALNAYCRYGNNTLTPWVCALNISNDSQQYGIPIDSYIEYLMVNLFDSEEIDEKIINELKKYQK